MKEKIYQFMTRYRTKLLILLLIIAILPAGVWAAVIQLLGEYPDLLHAREHHAKLTASAVSEIQETAATVPTDPPTEPETAPPTTIPTTEPVTEAPEAAMIEHVPYYSQRSLLPTGCELVSAKMVLEYYTGQEVPIKEITSRVNCQYPQWMDGKACAPHPSRAFIGDPWDPVSYGCFAGVVCDMMNELLPEGCVAEETSGTPVAELAEKYIPQNQPVLLWATIAMIDSYPHGGWYLLDEDGNATDEWYDWLASEHCLVLIGYDEDYYYFNDPYAWSGGTKFPRALVEKRHEEIGGYSAVVLKQEQSADPAE